MKTPFVRLINDKECEHVAGGVGGYNNPSETYGGLNWGQYKKLGGGEDVTALNPSMHYCRGTYNYGQYRKNGFACG
jgi:hypothetical protein